MEHLFVSVVTTGIIAGTPILLAASGEILAELSGVLNLGIEGMMLVGAVTGFMVTFLTHSHWLGLAMAMVSAGLLSLIHAFLTITLRANQVVSGLALAIFGTGLSGYLGKSLIGVPLPVTFKPLAIPILSEIPWLGTIFFKHDALVYLSFMLVALLWYFINRTQYGLEMRAVGENPGAADSAGINVYVTRYFFVIVGGMLAGAGGAYLSLAYAPSWLENMTAGRGWIALALVIFAAWNPVKAFMGSVLFGTIDVTGFHLQTLGVLIPSFFLKMLPYIITIIVLIIATSHSKKRQTATPEALGISYDREER